MLHGCSAEFSFHSPVSHVHPTTTIPHEIISLCGLDRRNLLEAALSADDKVIRFWEWTGRVHSWCQTRLMDEVVARMQTKTERGSVPKLDLQ